MLAGLTTPWGLVALKDGTCWSASGTPSRSCGSRAATKLLRTIEEAQPSGEGGLLGLAITPDESRVFAYYTAAEDNRIVAMSWDGRALGEPG